MVGDPGVSERVQRLFLETLNVQVPSEDADLIESGVIDSLALVELLFAIEREFDVSLPLDDLDIDNFRSVNRISDVIEATRA
jgi:D-alanine--poly(phosphoribitol) ligase subunit 2